MRNIFAFTAGLASSIVLVVLSGVVWGTSRKRIMQVFPQRGIEAWLEASMLICFAAFVAAIAFLFTFDNTVGIRQEWPAKSFALGAFSGAIAGGIVDVWCTHVMHSS